jgi:hypothetical protein
MLQQEQRIGNFSLPSPGNKLFLHQQSGGVIHNAKGPDLHDPL